ncbi:hypothetical protein C8R44DRAFT_870074 [Mycena epipterygia]|nr:hypothetical protein C8R44DRAFT_870074 [Mycena epipterygia]
MQSLDHQSTTVTYLPTYPSFVPLHLRQGSPEPKSQVSTPRRRLGPDDTEAPPPVPTSLHGQECLYGYTVTDELIKTYWAAHDIPLPLEYLLTSYKRITISRVAKELGLELHMDCYPYRDGIEDIAWFSYTDRGKVKGMKVPTRSNLECFAIELGITEDAGWIGTGIPVEY